MLLCSNISMLRDFFFKFMVRQWLFQTQHEKCSWCVSGLKDVQALKPQSHRPRYWLQHPGKLWSLIKHLYSPNGSGVVVKSFGPLLGETGDKEGATPKNPCDHFNHSPVAAVTHSLHGRWWFVCRQPKAAVTSWSVKTGKVFICANCSY